MVSRNTGWNMTDLGGSYLPRLMSRQECHDFYAFLERGNWVIFRDAYPQLLLYEKSKLDQKNYFHLLSIFHVSVFMEVLWHFFFEGNSSEMITLALVVNEQNHLEHVVMNNASFKKTVFDKIEFKLQDLLSMNQILFPTGMKDGQLWLQGKTIHQFEELHQRIQIGRHLYALLFQSNSLDSAIQWAYHTPHTGSRMDYWPHLFNLVNEEVPGIKRMHSRFKNGSLKEGEPRLYSPLWQYIWKDTRHFPPAQSDWFRDANVLHYLEKPTFPLDGDIENDYYRTLEKLEFAVVAKNVSTFL